jgi:hypothetical protein
MSLCLGDGTALPYQEGEDFCRTPHQMIGFVLRLGGKSDYVERIKEAMAA